MSARKAVGWQLARPRKLAGLYLSDFQKDVLPFYESAELDYLTWRKIPFVNYLLWNGDKQAAWMVLPPSNDGSRVPDKLYF
jgi:hypothetical protein